MPKLANPDKAVIVFVGDGGFQMTNQEFGYFEWLWRTDKGCIDQ